MKTTEIKTKLVNKAEVETTCNVINAMNGSKILKFITVNQLEKRSLFLISIEFGEAIFKRKSDWMRFVNKLNNYDDTPIKRMLTGNKKSFDWGGGIISRADIEYSEDGFLIEFKKPTQIVLEEIGDKYLIAEINKLKGKITWEWYHREKGHEELENYAGICGVFIYDTEIEL